MDAERNEIIRTALSSSLHTKITFYRVFNEIYSWTLVVSKCGRGSQLKEALSSGSVDRHTLQAQAGVYTSIDARY